MDPSNNVTPSSKSLIIPSSDTEKINYTLEIPEEVLRQIFLAVPCQQWGQLAQVCKRWCRVTYDINLWDSLATQTGLPSLSQEDRLSLAQKTWNHFTETVQPIIRLPFFSREVDFKKKTYLINEQNKLLSHYQQINTKEELWTFLQSFCPVVLPNQPYRLCFKKETDPTGCYFHVYIQKGGVKTFSFFYNDLEKEGSKLIKLPDITIRESSELFTPSFRITVAGNKTRVGPSSMSKNEKIDGTENYYGYNFAPAHGQFCYDLGRILDNALGKNLGKLPKE